MTTGPEHCCETMRWHLACRCPEHGEDIYACPDNIFDYLPKFDEYGIIVHDGGPSHIVIRYCPWCGTKLPESRRDDWFDAIEKLGMRPSDENLPQEFHSAAWRLRKP